MNSCFRIMPDGQFVAILNIKAAQKGIREDGKHRSKWEDAMASEPRVIVKFKSDLITIPYQGKEFL